VLNLADGASATLTIVLNVASNTADGQVISNTASLSSVTETETNPANDSDTETTDVAREVDLQVTKTATTDTGTAEVYAGSSAGNLTYVVTVTNDGPSDASGVEVSEVITIPVGVAIDSITASAGTSYAPPLGATGTWTVGNLAPTDDATLTVVMTVGEDAAEGVNAISDTATVSASNETRINTGDDEMTVSTDILSDFDWGDAPDNPPVLAAGPNSITGTIFDDLAGDGFAGTDPPLGGVQLEIFFDFNDNNEFEPNGDDGPRLTVAASDEITGEYEFVSLPEGRFFVRQDPDALRAQGLVETAGGVYTIALPAGPTTDAGNDFANFRLATISGKKFNDINGDGFPVSFADPGLADVPIQLHLDDGDGAFEPGGDDGSPIDTQFSASDGTFTFSGLDVGTYFVSEDPAELTPLLLTQTGGGDNFPSIKHYKIIVTASGQVEVDKDFANTGGDRDGIIGGGGGGGNDRVEAEPNDDINSATDTGLVGSGTGTVAGTVGNGAYGATSGDYDFFQLFADAGDTIRIDVAEIGGLNVELALYNSAGGLVTSTSDASLELLADLTTAGDLFLVLYGAGSGLPSPTVPGSGGGVGSTGDYVATIEIDSSFAGGDMLPGDYPTLKANDGARHVLVPTSPRLGTAVTDEENDGQPSVNADGDDLNGTTPDDEEGVVFLTPLIAGEDVDVQVTVTGDGLFSGWIDFDGDGQWIAGEQIFADVSLNDAGSPHTLTFTMPLTFPAGDTGSTVHSRFRYSTQAGLSYDGLATDGEVEDYEVTIAEFDYGDAPDAPDSGAGQGGPLDPENPGGPLYPTLFENDGARHAIIPGGPVLGAAIDPESDGQPNGFATGDDEDADGDDEDGVAFTSPLIPGGSATVDVTAVGGSARILNAWVDFDGDGSWDDAGEQVFTNVALIGGTNPGLSFPVPAGAVDGVTFARFRVDSGGGLSYDGSASDGEVEDYAVLVGQADFGDAPDPLVATAGEYPTLFANSGPFHLLGSGLFLGAAVDAEANGQPDATATGDDLSGTTPDDEDGLTALTTIVVTETVDTTASVVVTASAAGFLDGWIDWNFNGAFDAAEHLGGGTSAPLVAGDNLLNFTVPSNTDSRLRSGDTFARLRFSSAGSLPPTGPADDGEVEDYIVTLVDGDGAAAAVVDSHPIVGDVNITLSGSDVVVEQDGGIVVFQAPATSIASLTFNGTTGADTINVLETDAGVATAVNGDDGQDTVNVSDPFAGLGLLTSIGGTLTIDGGANPAGQPDTVTYFDEGEVGPIAYDLADDGVLTRAGSAVPVNLSNVELVALEAGSAGNAITVHASADVAFAIDGNNPTTAPGDSLFVEFPGATNPSVSSSAPRSGTFSFDNRQDVSFVDIETLGDLGDAPSALGYPTRLAANGALHFVRGPSLGSNVVDEEGDGQPNALATGDDIDGNDDEDGVTFTSILRQGQTTTLDVEASIDGQLDAFVDFNANGSFADPGEKIFDDVSVVAGTNNLSFSIPVGAESADTFARFRISTDGGLNSDGPAADGEVEDYAITIGVKLIVTPLGGGFYQFDAINVTPNGVATFLYGSQLGSLPLPQFGVTIDVTDPTYFAQGIADPNGTATAVVQLLPQLAGQTLFFQAFEQTPEPQVSPLATLTIPPVNLAVVNSTGDSSDTNPGDGVCDTGGLVGADPECTLRAAIEETNSLPNLPAGPDGIVFDIPGTGPHTIQPLSALPNVTDPVIIDGTSEPDFTGTPVVELDGSSAGATSNGLTVAAGGASSTIRGLAINRFARDGIQIDGGGNNTIEGNRIGTDLTGALDQGNGFYGVSIFNSVANQIGGTTPEAGNTISGNGRYGVLITTAGSTGNVVEGNRIGTDAAGNGAVPNDFHGVLIQGGASANTIGGTAPGAGNLISGNSLFGVKIHGPATTDNVVQGNRIGTDEAGNGALPNGRDGVEITGGANSNTIGGTAAGAENVISGNARYGVIISTAGTTGNMVEGNLIGSNAAGNGALPNAFHGVVINGGATGNTIGGTADEAGNVISGNARVGVVISNATTTGNVVQGNLIGTDVAGSGALPNNAHGVLITGGATGNTIGGTADGAGNVVSGNSLNGVKVVGAGTTANLVQGNLIGTDSAGNAPLANGRDGVEISTGATSNTIGGTADGAGNVISGNTRYGVIINTPTATGNMIEGNLIGTNAAGTGALGNGEHGIVTSLGAHSNTIGGTAAGAGNVISGNNNHGVFLGGENNMVYGNLIGTDVNGSSALGNAGSGVVVGADGNQIGAAVAGAENVIAYNGVRGVSIASGTGNAIRQNSIHDNGGATRLGIDLNNDNATANDVGDPDTGANNLQNFPELVSATINGAHLDIQYSVPSAAPNSAFPLTVEFFLADVDGQEGETYLGSDSYSEGTTPTATVPNGGAAAGTEIVATTTDANGNTSEFSASVAVASPLLAAGGDASQESRVEGQELRADDVSPIVDVAIDLLVGAGFAAESFSNVHVSVADLPGATLGLATVNVITIDVNAAGHGWFIDATPLDDSEFTVGESRSAAATRMDLLTVVMHELGHTAGLTDLYDIESEDDLMYAWLQPGERRADTAAIDSVFTSLLD